MTEIINEKNLIEYQRIFEETFGKSISRKAAYSQAVRLLNFTKALVEHTAKTNLPQELETLEDNIDNI